MMKSLKYIIAAAVISVAAEAQQVNTLYFMNNVQERSEYNPAFQPEHDIYVDLPVLPNFRLGFGNNSLKLNNNHCQDNHPAPRIIPLHHIL